MFEQKDDLSTLEEAPEVAPREVYILVQNEGARFVARVVDLLPGALPTYKPSLNSIHSLYVSSDEVSDFEGMVAEINALVHRFKTEDVETAVNGILSRHGVPVIF